MIIFGKKLSIPVFPQSQIMKIFNFRKIRTFLKETTGLDYEIHIVQEATAHGSILSLESDMRCHNRLGEETKNGRNHLDLPLSHVADLFKYHYMPNWKVGYMVDLPEDLNGQIQNL